jgi:hypothetical protein
MDNKSDPKSIEALLTLGSLDVTRATAERESCSCARCILSEQPDFKNQKSGLVEMYEDYNREHGTEHECIFLPKFHPELNPIERCWSKMKWYIRKYLSNDWF